MSDARAFNDICFWRIYFQIFDGFFLHFRCGTSMYEMVYRLLLGGVLNKTEHKPSVFSLISELDRAEDAGQLPERIFFGSEEETAIFVRYPGSRAKASIVTVPSAISVTSKSNKRRTNLLVERLRMSSGPRLEASIFRRKQRMRSPGA